MTDSELRKQISIFIPLTDWRKIRREAARQRIPMTELCRRWLRPHTEILSDNADDRRESSATVREEAIRAT